MKNLNKVLGIVLLSVLSFTSCESSDDSYDNENNTYAPTAEAFSNIKAEALANHTQTFQFDGNDGNVTLTTDNGAQIFINTDCLTLNGNPVTGTIDLEYVELYKKGSMLTTNKPTMGVLPNGDKALLISGGEFFIEATQNGSALDTNCIFQLTIPTSLTGGDDPAMTLWEGEIDENDNLAWTEDDGLAQTGVFLDGTLYNVFFASFGWNNVDRFRTDSSPKTTILVGAPQGYHNLNSNVYLSYDGDDTGLANLDEFDSGTGEFKEHYGQLPIGLECHIIFATEDNGNWRYAIKSTTITANQTYAFEYSETTVATEAELEIIINNLP